MIVLRILVASLVAWLSLGSSAEASPSPDAPVAVCTYDAPVYNAPGTTSVSERGPPAAGYADTTHDAVDRWSHGPSARPARVMPSATYTYDHPVLPVQVASGTPMTLGRAGATAGLPSPVEPSQLAANALPAFPKALSGGAADTRVYLGIGSNGPEYVGITNNLGRRATQHGDRESPRV